MLVTIHGKKSFLWKFFIGSHALPDVSVNSTLSAFVLVSTVFFSGLAHYFFMTFFLKLGFNKHKKVMQKNLFLWLILGKWSILDTKLKLLNFCLNLHFGFWVILGPVSTLLNISVNLLIRLFWNSTLWQALKSTLKWLF